MSGTVLLSLRCIKTHSEGNTAIATPTPLGTKTGPYLSCSESASVYTQWHTTGTSSSSQTLQAEQRATPSPQVSDCSGTSWCHTLLVFTPVPRLWQVMEGFGACCQGSSSAPLSFSAAELLFLKWEKAALPALKLSVEMAELMTLSQPSTNTQAQIGLVHKCSRFHLRETSEACSVSP